MTHQEFATKAGRMASRIATRKNGMLRTMTIGQLADGQLGLMPGMAEAYLSACTDGESDKFAEEARKFLHEKKVLAIAMLLPGIEAEAEPDDHRLGSRHLTSREDRDRALTMFMQRPMLLTMHVYAQNGHAIYTMTSTRDEHGYRLEPPTLSEETPTVALAPDQHLVTSATHTKGVQA